MGGIDVLEKALRTGALALAVRLCAAAVLAYAGLTKIYWPEHIVRTLTEAGLLRTRRLAVGIAFGAVELLVAASLIPQFSARVGGLACGILATGFAGFSTRALLTKAEYSCACFGRSDEPISKVTLARSFGLLAGGLVAFLPRGGGAGIEGWCRGIILASTVLGTGIMIAARRSTSVLAADLEKYLDWEWILQINAPDTFEPSL